MPGSDSPSASRDSELQPELGTHLSFHETPSRKGYAEEKKKPAAKLKKELSYSKNRAAKPHMGLRQQGMGLTCFHHACQGIAEARGLGGKYLHIVVHSAEEVCDENGVNIRSHERFQGWASN